jgi:hypothetical protein
MSANIAGPPQPDPLQAEFPMDLPTAVSPHLTLEGYVCSTKDEIQFELPNLEFGNPVNNPDVLQDFDFDSFLHQDGEGVDSFSFEAGFLEPQIGAD